MRSITGTKSRIHMIIICLILLGIITGPSKPVSFALAMADSEFSDLPEISESASASTKKGNLRGLGNSYGYGNNGYSGSSSSYSGNSNSNSNYSNNNYNKNGSKYSYFNNNSSKNNSSYNSYRNNSGGLPLLGKVLIIMGIAFVAVVLIMLVFPALIRYHALKKSTQGSGTGKYVRYNENDVQVGRSRKSKSTRKKTSRSRSNKTAKSPRSKQSKKNGGSRPHK